jgi:hypothetical protein
MADVTPVDVAVMIMEEMTDKERGSFGFFKRCYEEFAEVPLDPTTAQYLYSEAEKEMSRRGKDPIRVP